MLRLLGLFIKLSLFALAVLIAGNWIHWDGRSLSDQVRAQVSGGEPSNLVNKMTKLLPGTGSRKPAPRKDKTSRAELVPDMVPLSAAAPLDTAALEPQSAPAATAHGKAISPAVGTAEEIAPSERQRLRALIRELNRSRGSN
jgi:hypothetical protein